MSLIILVEVLWYSCVNDHTRYIVGIANVPMTILFEIIGVTTVLTTTLLYC